MPRLPPAAAAPVAVAPVPVAQPATLAVPVPGMIAVASSGVPGTIVVQASPSVALRFEGRSFDATPRPAPTPHDVRIEAMEQVLRERGAAGVAASWIGQADEIHEADPVNQDEPSACPAELALPPMDPESTVLPPAGDEQADTHHGWFIANLAPRRLGDRGAADRAPVRHECRSRLAHVRPEPHQRAGRGVIHGDPRPRGGLNRPLQTEETSRHE